jgi:hypothetical protein
MCERILHKTLSPRRCLQLGSTPCSAGHLCTVLVFVTRAKTTSPSVFLYKTSVAWVCDASHRSQQTRELQKIANLSREPRLLTRISSPRIVTLFADLNHASRFRIADFVEYGQTLGKFEKLAPKPEIFVPTSKQLFGSLSGPVFCTQFEASFRQFAG